MSDKTKNNASPCLDLMWNGSQTKMFKILVMLRRKLILMIGTYRSHFWLLNVFQMLHQLTTVLPLHAHYVTEKKLRQRIKNYHREPERHAS